MSRFVIAACSRSGTHYITNLLRKAGLEVGHQKWGCRDGLVSHDYAGNPMVASSSSAMDPARFEAKEVPIVLHQVRHPLDTIASIMAKNIGLKSAEERWWPYVRRCLPSLPKTMYLGSIMDYWIRWNKLAEARAVFTYPIERIEKAWPEIMRLIIRQGVPFPGELEIEHRAATEHPDLSWIDLAREDLHWADEIREMATRYGYRRV